MVSAMDRLPRVFVNSLDRTIANFYRNAEMAHFDIVEPSQFFIEGFTALMRCLYSSVVEHPLRKRDVTGLLHSYLLVNSIEQ